MSIRRKPIVIAACEPFRHRFVNELRKLGELHYDPGAWRDPDRLSNSLRQCRVLVTRNKTRVDKYMLEQHPSIACIAIYGAGTDHIDISELRRKKIHLIRCSKEIARTMAEFTVCLAISLLRRVHEAVDQVRSGGWDHRVLIGRELAGRTVLVVGCGPIGQRVALLFATLGCRVAIARGSNRHLPIALRRRGCRLVKLETGLRLADIVTLHVCGGEGTRSLIGAKQLSLMKPRSYLINTSRGETVNLEDLIVALRREQIAGAALDVLPEEPPKTCLPPIPQLLITPHVALYSEEAVARRINVIVDSIRRWLSGYPTSDQ